MIHQYLHLTKRVLLSNVKRLASPYKLTFAITYRCNSRCKTCNIWKRKVTNELSKDEIKCFFQNSNDFHWIDLTGGEPSLRKDFVDICEAIHRRSKNLVLLHFPTNGYLTDKIVNDVKEIRKMGSSYKIAITVSTDGDERLNDEIRGVKGAWKRQIETFIRLREIENVITVLGMTLSPLNFDKFEMTFNSVKNVLPWVTVKDFHISLMNYSDIFYDNMDQKNLISDPIERKKVVEGIIQSTELYTRMMGIPENPRSLLEHLFLKRAKGYFRTGKTPLPCHALKSSCFIDPTGQVYPCITFDQPLGNLRDHNYELEKIWNSESAKRLQKKIWNLKCPQCWTGCDGYQTIMGNLIHLFRNNSSRVTVQGVARFLERLGRNP
jgi:radical SAM protein with 4Fe4S-binding SPASM domain